MNNFTSYKEDPLVSAAAQIMAQEQLSEGIVSFPSYRAKGKGIYIGKDLVSKDDLGSAVDTVNRQVDKFPLFGKYLEVHSGSDSIRGECVGYAHIHGAPMLLIRDSNYKEVWIDADRAQREIYAFTPAKKDVTTTGTGSSDNPMLYSFGKTNY
jgi:hypothetical protein